MGVWEYGKGICAPDDLDIKLCAIWGPFNINIFYNLGQWPTSPMCSPGSEPALQQYTNARRDSGRATSWGCQSPTWEIFHVCSSSDGDTSCLSRRRRKSHLLTGCCCRLQTPNIVSLTFNLSTHTYHYHKYGLHSNSFYHVVNLTY